VLHHLIEDVLHHVGVDQVAFGLHHFLELHRNLIVRDESGDPVTARRVERSRHR
jgi:hypothetical protein